MPRPKENPLACPYPGCTTIAKSAGGLGSHKRIHLPAADRRNRSRSEADIPVQSKPSKQSLSEEEIFHGQEITIQKRTSTKRSLRALPEIPPDSTYIPEGTLAVAVGEFKGFLKSLALEYDLPYKPFARKLIELISREAVW